MKKMICMIAAGVMALSVPYDSFAQSAEDKQLARAYYFSAQEAYEAGKYQDALDGIESAEKTSGQTGTVLLSLKAKTLYKMGRYEEVKRVITQIYGYSPSAETRQEMGTLLIDADKQIESQRAAKAEADRLQREADAKARAEEAERQRLAPLISAEKRKRDAILKNSSVMIMPTRLDLSGANGKNGASGKSGEGFLISGTINGANGKNGSPGEDGQDAGSYTVYMEQIKFDHFPDIALVSIKNNNNGHVLTGYWDTASKFSIYADGGAGGSGGNGGVGGRGKNEGGSILGRPRGGNGGNGGRPGQAGNGGDGADIKIFYVGSADFRALLSGQDARFFVDRKGGRGGAGGKAGKGGKGGFGGCPSDLGMNFGGSRCNKPGKAGYQIASHAEKGATGQDGTAKINKGSLTDFQSNQIAIHQFSGPTQSNMTLEAFKSRSQNSRSQSTPTRQSPAVQNRDPLDSTASGRPTPGIKFRDIIPETDVKRGVSAGIGALITEVKPGSAADLAGLRLDDVIYVYDSKEIISAFRLAEAINNTASNEAVTITYWRGDKLLNTALSPSDIGAGGNPGAVSDRDAAPLMRIPPIFPPKILQGNYSGYCKMRFDVSAEGQPYNITDVLCTSPLLEEASRSSIEKWRYDPKILDGRPAKRVGVETTIRFDLSDASGKLLPMPPGVPAPF